MHSQLIEVHAERKAGTQIEWLSEIPFDWELLPGFRVFDEVKNSNKGMLQSTVLSLSYGNIVIKPEEKLVGLVPDSFETYQVVEPGDIVIRCTDLQNDQKSLRTGLTKNNGIITSAYLNLRCKDGFSPRFVHLYLHALDLTKVLYKFGSGLRQNLSFEDFKRLPIPAISYSEQERIADFVDHRSTEIDQAIATKEKQIELLNERKAILIQNAVTRGLNPDAPLQDCGIEQVGSIPKHWEVARAKYLFREVDERSKDGSEELLSVSHMTGVTPRSEKTVHMFMAEDYTGSKTCQKGDLVYNIMWAWMGALGVAPVPGIVSSSYGVYRPRDAQQFNPDYLEWLMRSAKYVEHYNRVSTGLHSSRLRFYADMFMDMAIGFPPRQEQDEIVIELKKQTSLIDEGIGLQKAQIERLKEYKATLIDSAVTGKIRITEDMISSERGSDG